MFTAHHSPIINYAAHIQFLLTYFLTYLLTYCVFHRFSTGFSGNFVYQQSNEKVSQNALQYVTELHLCSLLFKKYLHFLSVCYC